MRNVYVSVDGDDIGREIERALLEGDVDAAVLTSRTVAAALDGLAERLGAEGFDVLFASGDSLLARGPSRSLSWLGEHLARLGVSFSGGLGDSPALAHLALRSAKAHGKARVARCEMDRAGDSAAGALRFDLQPVPGRLASQAGQGGVVTGV